jgi:hypothetical protein
MFYDSDGELMATSLAMPNGRNIGQPAAEQEIEAFVGLLENTAPRMTRSDRDRLAGYLLQIAMDDVLRVRLGQRGGDLGSIASGELRSDRSLVRLFRERDAFEELHDQAVLADVVECADVGMAERRNQTGFALEAPTVTRGRELDRDGASEARVDRSVHRAHPTGAEPSFDPIGSQRRWDRREFRVA